MCRWLALIFATTVTGMVFAACSSTTPASIDKKAATVTTTHPQTTSQTTTLAPTTTSACESSGTYPGPFPTVAQLAPLLLTVNDVPFGYTTTGPHSSTFPEFDGAVSTAVPTAYITFSMGEDPGPTFDIIEAVAEATSPHAATSLLNHVNAVATECGFGAGTRVALPGVVPNLTATTTTGGTSNEYISTAEVFTTKDRYLVEVRWFNSQYIPENPATETQTPGPQPLPTPTVMGSVVDAALAHIPA